MVDFPSFNTPEADCNPYGVSCHGTPRKHEYFPKDYFVPSRIRLKLRNHLQGAVRRCYDPKTIGFRHWGGRGIRIAHEWYDEKTRKLHTRAFIEWAVRNGWKEGLQLDRIDNNKNYSPSNCRWVTSKENCRNRRDNRIIEKDGVKKCLSQWAEELGIPYNAMKDRCHQGWDDERIISEKVKPHKRIIEFQGARMCLEEWARKLGIEASSLRDRFRNGWSIEDALTKGNNGGHNRKITHSGETRTIKEWATHSGIPYRTLLGRLNRGWDFAVAITAEKGFRK